MENTLITCAKTLKMFCKLEAGCGIIIVCMVKEVQAVMEKEIFAALEIADEEIRLILGEFFNTRFNVLKVEQVACSGIEKLLITDREALTGVIRRTLANASGKLGARIERVLLSIPAKNARQISMKVTVPIESIDKKVTILDIRKAVRNAMNVQLDSSLALINVVCVRYTCNGITTRRIPLGEICDQLTVQIDLLCADKKLTFDIVSCVEEAGCSVMDVCLDCYAIAKEACLFEQTVDQNVIILKLEQKTTSMALLYDGRLVSSQILDQGYGSLVKALADHYRLPYDIASRLVKYNADLAEEDPKDTPIYIWSRGQVTSTLSKKQLKEEIEPSAVRWMTQVQEGCKEILESRATSVVLCGEGAEIAGLAENLQQKLGCQVRRYVPETLGARKPALASCLGLFYAFKDQGQIMGISQSSVDLNELKKSIEFKQVKPVHKESEENTITGKLKSILFDSRN